MLNSANLSNNWAQFKTDISDFLNEMIISYSGVGGNGVKLSEMTFSSNKTYEGYTYRATIPITGVKSTYYPFVSFSSDAIKTGLFNNAIVETYDGGVYIYATNNPKNVISNTNTVIVNLIKCIK